MKHWIRDMRYSYGSWNSVAFTYALFHFLRVMGWTWLWECDGTLGDDPNHCDDGNMEEVGTAKYTALGTGAISKVTTPLHSGTQVMEVDSSAVNDGIQTAVLLGMSDGFWYQVAIWASNNTGSSWEVEIDPGDTAFVSQGSIPHNGGVWTLYHFDFFSVAPNPGYVRIIDNNNTQGTIHLDAINIFRSFYEYNPADALPEGTDGIVTNPDQFSTTASYTFVAGDVGKFIAVRDTGNLGNTGVWAITAVAAGVATLELRSATAALANASGLTWRMFDITKAPIDTASDVVQRSAGFGLESPHSSSWRLFIRPYMSSGQVNKWITVWSAPEDTEFDFSTGNFWKTGPSVQNPRIADYTTVNMIDQHYTSPPYTLSGTCRFFFMTDDTGSFVSAFVKDDAYARNGFFTIGYTGTDVDHPGIEEFAQLCPWETIQSGISETEWRGNSSAVGYNWVSKATGFGSDGLAHLTSSDVLGTRLSGGANNTFISMLNAGPNPWSGDEWLRTLRVIRDPEGSEGYSSERDADIGIYQGRENMAEVSTFDNDGYLHLADGVVWEWMSESL